MYAFHGWINIWPCDPDEADRPKVDAAIAEIRSWLAMAEEEVRGWFEIRETFNGQIILVAHGLRNHRQSGPPDLFRRVGSRYPLSYGLLYVHDDEDPIRGNEFVVYRLAHGEVAEHPDTLLSPFIPTVELPYSSEGGGAVGK